MKKYLSSINLAKSIWFFGGIIICLGCKSGVHNGRNGEITPKIVDKTASSTTVLGRSKRDLIEKLTTGADNFELYLPLLRDKKVGIVTNQTGIISIKGGIQAVKNEKGESVGHGEIAGYSISIVDFLVGHKINVQKIFAPEHGFRGIADAGEHIIDGKDSKTGVPIFSIYGNKKKLKPEQLDDIDIMIFDLQDVGARFYTYISSLHYMMESCAEANIPLLVLDRPNPNGGIVDGPVLENEFSSFVGMHQIPVLHGMTIGEYAQMINGEHWLKNGEQCRLTVIHCTNYSHKMAYNLPVKPSPNLPNEQAVNLYPSLCFFEGTNISVGRGTEKQFQIYGSPQLPKINFEFVPMPNLGSKEPMYQGKTCYGEDLSKVSKVTQLELKWLIAAYQNCEDKKMFFNPFFTKLAGTDKLQQQIEAEIPEIEIRKTWQQGLKDFKKTRQKYLLYP